MSDIDTLTRQRLMAIEECPAGHVLVIDSRGDAMAASAGNLLVARLMKRGGAGVVTNGGFRDTPEIAAMDFPAYHVRPSAPTNLIRHQAADLQLPIGRADPAQRAAFAAWRSANAGRYPLATAI